MEIFTARGYRCAIWYNNVAGFYCGYIEVLKDHPWHGKHYDDVAIDVHGGVTYAEQECHGIDEPNSWWFGFDCGHVGDFCKEIPGLGGEFRDEEFVRKELQNMAEQVSAAAKDGGD